MSKNWPPEKNYGKIGAGKAGGGNMDSWKKDSRREAVITDIDALNLPSLAVAA